MGDYRDLAAWQEANRLAHAVFDAANAHWRPQNAAVFDQVRRSVLSVVLNLAEGHAYGPCLKCRAHFHIAYGSAVETEAALRFLAERGFPGETMLRSAASVRGLTYKLWKRCRTSA